MEWPPVCQAGDRGFKSRRSRRKGPWPRSEARGCNPHHPGATPGGPSTSISHATARGRDPALRRLARQFDPARWYLHEINRKEATMTAHTQDTRTLVLNQSYEPIKV